MGLFEHFPYTNFHDLNLDKILERTKEAEVAVAASAEAAEQAAADVTAIHGEATQALNTANAASVAAANAVNTANTANTAAGNAVSTANAANTAAGNAVSTANAANTAAGNAVSTANTAASQATLALNNSINYRSYWIPIIVSAQGGTAVNGSSSVVEEYVNAIWDYTHKTLIAKVYLYNEDDFTVPISIVSQAPNDLVFKVEGITARTSSQALFFTGQLHYTRADADSAWERVVADCTSNEYAVALSAY